MLTSICKDLPQETTHTDGSSVGGIRLFSRRLIRERVGGRATASGEINERGAQRAAEASGTSVAWGWGGGAIKQRLLRPRAFGADGFHGPIHRLSF